MAKRLKTNLIVIHCSATPESRDIGAKEIREWHTLPYPQGRGWSDIGYHKVIRLDGEIENGRPIDFVGAHVEGHNHDSVGICLVGGIDANDHKKAKDTFTPVQKEALRGLLLTLKSFYPDAKIVGHRDLDNRKSCPCFSVKDWLEQVGLEKGETNV